MALAILIVGLAIVPTLSLFFGTSRLANKSTGVFREAVAGQMIWEVLKYRSAINPFWLRDVPPTQLGAFVTSDGPRDFAGQPIPLSPLVEYMFNRTGGALYQPSNEDSLSGTQSLAHNFQDLAFRVTVANGSVPAWKPTDAAPSSARETLELVKDVSIEVFRAGPADHRIREPAAFRLDSELVTPVDSLSLEALTDLQHTQDGYSYARDLELAYRSMAPVTEAVGLPQAAAVAGSNLALVAIESVGEAILTDASDLGFGVPIPGPGTHAQLDSLVGKDGKFGMWMKADLHVEAARGIFIAYRRSIVPLHELNIYMKDLSGRLSTIQDSLKQYKDAHLGAERALQAGGELANVTEGLFWRQLFVTQTKWAAALERPEIYPARYAINVDLALSHYAAVEADPESWPMERVWSLNSYLEVDQAKKMFLAAPSIPEDALIARRAGDYRDMHRPYSEALEVDKGRTLATLVERNALFSTLELSLAALKAPDSEYEQLMQFIRAGGGLMKVLTAIEQTTTTALADTMQRLDSTLSGFVQLKQSGRRLPVGQVPAVDLAPGLAGTP